MTGLPWWPVVGLDVAGSAAVLALSGAIVARARSWARSRPNDLFRHYLYLFTAVIAVFALSRSVGHLLKQWLLLAGREPLWRAVAPYSGAANTCAFVAVFAFSLLFGLVRRSRLQVEQKELAATAAEARATQAARDIERLRAVFDGIQAFVCVSDSRHRILYANRAVKALLAETGEDPSVCRVFCNRPPPGDAGECADCSCEAVLVGGKTLHTERQIPGTQRTVRMDEIPIRWVGGQRAKLTVAHDITEAKRLEQRLAQAQRLEALGTLAGGIAHDFNNILAAVVGHAELALMEPELRARTRTRTHLDRILEASLRAGDVVRQILAFSRHSPAERGPVRVTAVVREALALLRASIPSTVEIRTRLDEDCGTVNADPAEIHQVLMNLCTNAQYAMRDTGGLLEVALDCPEGLAPDLGPVVRLTVRDTGPGIDEDALQRVSEPYFTTKPVGEGSGLGLAVVHGIVTELGGRISVTSRPGQGAAFEVLLPRTSEPEDRARSREPTGGTERVLLVDDEPQVLDVGRSLLASLGYRVTAVDRCTEALELFRAAPDGFDLVLTDQTVPEMTGLELAREILKMRPEQPVVLCTGYSDRVDEARVRAAGIRALLMKPFGIRVLAETVRAALGDGPPSEPP